MGNDNQSNTTSPATSILAESTVSAKNNIPASERIDLDNSNVELTWSLGA